MKFNFGLGLEKDVLKKGEESLDIPKAAEGFVSPTDIREGAVHNENKYNNPDEGFLKQEKTFVPIEEVVDPDSGEEQFINKLSDKLENKLDDEMEIDEDKYDFTPLINGLVKTAQEKGEKELDEVITKAAKFIKQYREILKSGLSDERNEKKESEGKEYEACQKAFKDIFGDIVYIGDKHSGSVELLKNQVKIYNAKHGAPKGQKIYYGLPEIGRNLGGHEHFVPFSEIAYTDKETRDRADKKKILVKKLYDLQKFNIEFKELCDEMDKKLPLLVKKYLNAESKEEYKKHVPEQERELGIKEVVNGKKFKIQIISRRPLPGQASSRYQILDENNEVLFDSGFSSAHRNFYLENDMANVKIIDEKPEELVFGWTDEGASRHESEIRIMRFKQKDVISESHYTIMNKNIDAWEERKLFMKNNKNNYKNGLVRW